jgi:hypothetical protein
MSGRDDRRDRAERLGEALRENLRRRKAQARSRREPDPQPACQGGQPAPRVDDEATEDGRRD